MILYIYGAITVTMAQLAKYELDSRAPRDAHSKTNKPLAHKLIDQIGLILHSGTYIKSKVQGVEQEISVPLHCGQTNKSVLRVTVDWRSIEAEGGEYCTVNTDGQRTCKKSHCIIGI